MRFPYHAGNHGCLPVVAVHNVGPVVQLVEHFDDGLLEIGETLTVIVIAVQGIPFEISLVLYEEECHRSHHGAPDADRHFMIVDGHCVFAAEVQVVHVFFRNLAVQGKNHLHFITLVGQGTGKRTNDIRQSAGFDKRETFGSDHENRCHQTVSLLSM